MKNINLFALLLIIGFQFSCENNITEAEITYTKATAIYGTFGAHRSLVAIESAREIQEAGKVYVSNDMLLIGERNKGIHLFDNSNPENPIALNFINVPLNNEFYVHKNHVFAESLYDLIKIDISDISNPKIEDRIDDAFLMDLQNSDGEYLLGFEHESVTEMVSTDSEVYKMRANSNNTNNTAYLDFEERLIPESQVPIAFVGSGDVAGTLNRMAYSHGHLYVINDRFITVIDDENGFEFVSIEEIGRRMEMIYPQDNALFIGTDRSMEIYDIMSPADPIYKAALDHAPACDPVLPNGDVAYVTLRDVQNAEIENVLIVVDISDLSNPVALEEIPLSSPYGLAMVGDKLFVTEGEHGLKIFDISDPKSLRFLGHDISLPAYDVIPHPNHPNVILLANSEGISQYSFESDLHFSLLSQIDF